MSIAPKMKESMSPKLLRVAELAKKDSHVRFTSLAHMLDKEALKRSFKRLNKSAAVGVDGVTKEKYGEKLDENVEALHTRMRAMKYRHQPIKRVHIRKSPTQTRPIGISSTEDKVVQGALAEVLGAIYEQDFLPCSFGYRPGRSAHDALRELDRAVFKEGTSWILEADIKSYFDSIDRKILVEILRERIADPSFLRLISKCLHAGVLEGEEFSTPDVGTAQGSILSPLLGNIFLHHVLDIWYEREVKSRLKGRSTLVRFADDFVITFEHREDAKRVMDVLGKRMQKFGLTLHPEKTRLFPFRNPDWRRRNEPEPQTFDFLGFTVFWRKSWKGRWNVAYKTRTSRLRRAIESVGEFCRRHRHKSVKEQHEGLCRRMTGHMNYFGVNGNQRSLAQLVYWTERVWRKWLNRRSQRGKMTWSRFEELLKRHQLPSPTIRVQVWVKA